MSEDKEFLIVKIIVTTITSIIAILLIALFNCVIANAENIPIDVITLSGGTSGECSGSYDYVRVGCTGNYKKVWARFYDSQGILFTNTTHNFEISMQVWGVSTTGIPSISKKIYVWNGNSYIQATPDRNESFTVRPIEGNYTRFGAIWTFELDSTINSQFITIEFEMNGGSFQTLRDYTLNIIYPTDDETRQVIGAIGEQTNSINQNNNNNTNRIIENMLPGIQDAQEIFKNGQSKGTYEGNRRDETGINQAESIEGQIKYGYNNGNVNIDFTIPDSNAYDFIWNWITEIATMFNLTIVIITAISLMVLSQILGRR